jgi:hypothetical protein
LLCGVVIGCDGVFGAGSSSTSSGRLNGIAIVHLFYLLIFQLSHTNHE